jgi:hypothetical protein
VKHTSSLCEVLRRAFNVVKQVSYIFRWKAVKNKLEPVRNNSRQHVLTQKIRTIVTMVYNTENRWVSGLYPLSIILNTKKHNVSETGSVSVLRLRDETPTLLGPSVRANFNNWSSW